MPTPSAAPRPALLAAAVFAGGCVGGLGRHLLTLALPSAGGLPWGVAVANTAGALLLGVLLGRAGQRGPAWLVPAVGTGLLGAFTTMSGVASAAVVSSHDGAPAAAAWIVVLSAAAGLAAAAAGLRLGRR
ncbi:MAG TPA: CrcB family protein [Mycobacteriales bacterium]|nr:CrcB family protein [Mycobacteriales bacterium]